MTLEIFTNDACSRNVIFDQNGNQIILYKGVANNILCVTVNDSIQLQAEYIVNSDHDSMTLLNLTLDDDSSCRINNSTIIAIVAYLWNMSRQYVVVCGRDDLIYDSVSLSYECWITGQAYGVIIEGNQEKSYFVYRSTMDSIVKNIVPASWYKARESNTLPEVEDSTLPENAIIKTLDMDHKMFPCSPNHLVLRADSAVAESAISTDSLSSVSSPLYLGEVAEDIDDDEEHASILELLSGAFRGGRVNAQHAQEKKVSGESESSEGFLSRGSSPLLGKASEDTDDEEEDGNILACSSGTFRWGRVNAQNAQEKKSDGIIISDSQLGSEKRAVSIAEDPLFVDDNMDVTLDEAMILVPDTPYVSDEEGEEVATSQFSDSQIICESQYSLDHMGQIIIPDSPTIGVNNMDVTLDEAMILVPDTPYVSDEEGEEVATSQFSDSQIICESQYLLDHMGQIIIPDSPTMGVNYMDVRLGGVIVLVPDA